jgi:hypothetical protein
VGKVLCERTWFAASAMSSSVSRRVPSRSNITALKFMVNLLYFSDRINRILGISSLNKTFPLN